MTPVTHTNNTEKQNSIFRTAVQNLSPNKGAELLRYGLEREGIISIAQGESSHPTPDFICDAANRAMKEGKTFYGPALGQPALREEISDYYNRIYNLNVGENRIFVTGSGTTAMHLALTAVLDEGDEVIAVTPIWKNLLGAVELTQSKIIQIPLKDTGRKWELDINTLFAAVTDRTKVILVVTPSNPTGWIMPEDQIKQLVNFARERGIWIISDEVYGRIAYGRKHAPSFLEYSNPDDRLFVVNSFSKAWSMTGWRLGWLAGPEYSENTIRDIALYDNMGPATFTQFGGVEALKNGEDFISEQMKLWESNLDLIMERLERNPKITMNRPQGTFYAFFKVKGEEDCIGLAKRLIDEAALSLVPGSAFGQSSKGYLRFCFAVSRDIVLEALDRLESVIQP